MIKPDLKTLLFIFDNENDHLLMQRLNGDGPLKGKYSGLKGDIGLYEDINDAAIRSLGESSGLKISEAVLRGVVKVVGEESKTAVVYFVYETALFSGKLNDHLSVRLKWVDILQIFNLTMEGLVQEIMPRLLDGESFFEGNIHLNGKDEVVSCTIR